MAESVAASPSGKTIYVTGHVFVSALSPGTEFAAVAYNAITGAQLWIKFYSGGEVGADDEPYAMAVSRTTGTVFVAGYAVGKNTSGYDYTTISYHG